MDINVILFNNPAIRICMGIAARYLRFTAMCVGLLFLGCESPRKKIASLPYRQFDQTPDGWRQMADRKRFGEAARLIEYYLSRHPELSPSERAMLHFHAGQLFGFVNDRENALRHLDQSAVPEGTVGFPTKWNDYTIATKAFIKRDHAEFSAARERMAMGAVSEQDRVFLGTIDWLRERFGQTYGEAYLSQITGRK